MTINTYYNKKTGKTIIKTYKGNNVKYRIDTRSTLKKQGYDLIEIIRIDEEAIAKLFKKS